MAWYGAEWWESDGENTPSLDDHLIEIQRSVDRHEGLLGISLRTMWMAMVTWMSSPIITIFSNEVTGLSLMNTLARRCLHLFGGHGRC